MQNFSDNINIDSPGWLLEQSTNTDVVIGAEAAAIRNIADSSFCTASDDDNRLRIQSAIELALDGAYNSKISLEKINPVEKFCLSERWTVPFHLVENPSNGILMTNLSESESAVVCGIDHIMIRFTGALEKLHLFADSLRNFIDSLEEDFGWARHPRFGYLSPNPAMCGAGYIFSTICHIPASLLANKLGEIRQITEALNIQLRDPWIGGFDGANPFVRLTTFSLVGRSFSDLLAAICQATEAVTEIERNARNELGNKSQPIITDKVMRAYGIVTHAKLVELWEFNSLVATLRLGAAMGVIPIPIRSTDEILILGQQAHIGAAIGQAFTPMQAAIERAELIRAKLGIE